MTGVGDHWAAQYIGRPWAETDHCLDFARRVWREVKGWDVPAVATDLTDPRAVRRAFEAGVNGGLKSGWQEVETPAEFDAVVMARGLRACHIGVWATPPGEVPGILHSIDTMGVIWTPRARLIPLGFAILGFWRFECAPLS